jgi:peptidoglycan/LPS O-acetylase OafA/YrhL
MEWEKRVLALDGLRGCLAVVVVGAHYAELFHTNTLYLAGQFAVVIFFLMSGYVLTRSWDGGYVAFLARRFVRLWPTYAICLAGGYLIARRAPVFSEFFWYPYLSPNDPQNVDQPVWSLILEAWVMPFMPLIVWAGTGSIWRAIPFMVAGIVLMPMIKPAVMLTIFIAGAFLSRAEFRNRFLESSVPQWLGKVSYSLYLVHVLVLTMFVEIFGLWWGAAAALPVIFTTAWAIWFLVEKPSILLSRRVGSWINSRV